MSPQRAADLILRLGEPVERADLPGRFVLESFVPETVEPDPSDPDDPGGAGINLTVHAGTRTVDTYVNADPAAPPTEIWTDRLRLVVVDYDDAVPSISVTVDLIAEEFIADQTRTVTLKPNETIELDDGASMRFGGHSHKKTMPGQTSPLIVEVTYRPSPHSVSYHSLRPPEQTTWTWRDFEFEMLDWDYNARMDLQVRRRKLVPLSPPNAEGP